MKHNFVTPLAERSTARPPRALLGMSGLLLAAGLVMAPLSAHAATQTKIFFVSDRDSTTSIWTADADSANPAKLIANATDPALSLDGTRLAFVQNGDIYIAKVAITGGAVSVTGLDNSATLTALTSDGGTNIEASPSFSPSGDRLIFERGPVADPDLFIIPSNGSTNVPTSAFARTGAANSPRFVNETQIVFAARGASTSTQTLDPTFNSLVSFVLGSPTNSFVVQEPGSSSANAVTRLTVSPLPTPIGRKVVYTRFGGPTFGLYQDNLDDGSLGSPLRLTLKGDDYPSFSPDGTKIIFSTTNATRGGSGGAGEIYLLNADNSGVTRLTNDPANDFAPVIGDITVIGAPNTLPKLNNATYTGSVGSSFSQQLPGTDADAGDTLTYTLASGSAALPAGLTLLSNGLISGTPTTARRTDFSVNVSDGKATITAKFIIIISAAGTDGVGPVMTRGALNPSYTRTGLAGLIYNGTVRDVAQSATPTVNPVGVKQLLFQLRQGATAYSGNETTGFTTDLNRGYFPAFLGTPANPAGTAGTSDFRRNFGSFIPSTLPVGAYSLVILGQDNLNNFSVEVVPVNITTPTAPPAISPFGVSGSANGS